MKKFEVVAKAKKENQTKIGSGRFCDYVEVSIRTMCGDDSELANDAIAMFNSQLTS